MAKQFRRRESGLIVNDDTFAVPKSAASKPWYAGRLTRDRAAVMFKSPGVVLFSAPGVVAMSPNCCCGGLPCSACVSGTAPKSVILRVSGITGTGVFDTCYSPHDANPAALNTDYELIQDENDGCHYEFSPDVGDVRLGIYDDFQIDFIFKTRSSPGDLRMVVSFSAGISSPSCALLTFFQHYFTDIADPFDCGNSLGPDSDYYSGHFGLWTGYYTVEIIPT